LIATYYAIGLRNTGNSFKLVYPLVINAKRNSRHYIKLGVDGIMTNRPAKLKSG